MLIFAFFCFFLITSLSAAEKPAVDIVVFSPHPDDETLCCGGTILKAIHDNKKVKIVFLTNGDAHLVAASSWLKKSREELSPGDYVALGEERQQEALKAIAALGLNEDDVIFLSYPDEGLSLIWDERYNVKPSHLKDKTHNFYKSGTTNTFRSPYKKTYARATAGYNRENLTDDIKEILKKYKPKKIYIPSPLDRHRDHVATTEFVNRALDQLRYEDKEWGKSSSVFYYTIHPRDDFSQYQNYKEDIRSFKDQKAMALKEYQSQLKQEREFQESFLEKDYEFFFEVPNERQAYLDKVHKEWEKAAKIMKEYGYNVNFGVIADVADNIDDSNIVLVKRQKIYSQNPETVFQLVLNAVPGTNAGGITPVVKHFPGLGRARHDTHTSLPKINVSKQELYQRDLLPFRKLIQENVDFWIMVDHAIYPCLDDKPASLSPRIQTDILRKELGFNGIIIADELLNMQAIKEYAIQQGIKDPYIGKIVAMAFQAGADIAIIYLPLEKQKEVVNCVVEAVKDAIKEKNIKEDEINASVERILKEKERIFKKPLRHLLKDMSLDEKILQKLIIDTYENAGILNEYNLGGIHAREYRVIQEAQRNSKIPMFVAGQHEGGSVSEIKLNIYTQSAYLTGREFERTFVEKEAKAPFSTEMKDEGINHRQQEPLFNLSELNEDEQQIIINILSDSIDEQIRFYSELSQKKILPPPNPDYLSPLTIYQSDNGMKVDCKPFENLPVLWLRKFPDKERALCAYRFFKEVYYKWLKNINNTLNKKRFNCYLDKLIYELSILKEEITHTKPQKDIKVMRVLCLACHPDDEDAEALAYFKKKFNCETYILLATRGEGGENKVNASLYEELGFLRTEEIERSASILGVKKIFYLGKKDFGYCVDPDKALQKWGKEDALEKLIYFFRLIRPHIIITRHDKFNINEHCQHRALAILADEAFDLAADPKAYPEMLKEGLVPWQPLRYYQRITGRRNFELDDFVIDTKENAPSEQKTYHQIALEALSQHKSQDNLSFLCPEGELKIAYHLVKTKDPLQADSTLADELTQEEEKIEPSGFPGIKIVSNLRIGLIEGNNNILFIALKTLGCDFKRLNEEFIKSGDLSQFDTIVVGQGAYAVLPVLIQANERILKFVENGGNLVVFTQDNKQPLFVYAPYPIEICFKPITDGNVPVKILVPNHSLFTFPNKVSTQDFDGWVQERGLLFPCKYSDKYAQLIACPSSTGERVKGGYLVTHYGEGSYIYTTFAWPRQFREFHLGAYKNLSNMLAYGYIKNKNPKK